MADAGDPLLDLIGYRDISDDGSVLSRRSQMNFIGFTIEDNPELGTTDVTALAGGGSVTNVSAAAISVNLLSVATPTTTPVLTVLNQIINTTAGSNYYGVGTGIVATDTALANTAFGPGTLPLLTAGDDIIAIGSGVGPTITTTSDLILIGNNAGSGLTTGDGGLSIAIGHNAMSGGGEFGNILVIGHNSADTMAGAEDCLVIGSGSADVLAGVDHTIVGHGSGRLIVATSSGVTTLGRSTGNTVTTADNITLIGANTDVPIAEGAVDGYLNIHGLIYGSSARTRVQIGGNRPVDSTFGDASLRLNQTDAALMLNVLANDAAVTTPEDGMLMYSSAVPGVRARVSGAWIALGAGGGAVTSVFTRTGAVVAAASDYDASQVDNDSSVTGAFVDDAFNTLWARDLIAGAGMTGGGDLSADRTFNVIANVDGSIVVNANDIQVGVLASDAQHGVRGGGTQHADVIAGGADGFMTGADKTKLDGIEALADVTDVANVTSAGAAILAGQAGGQALIGGTASGNDLTLESTSDGTKGSVVLAAGTDLDLSDEDVVNAKTITFADPDVQTTAGATLTIDFSSHQKHRITLASNITTVTLTDPLGSGNFVVEFIQNGTGLFTVTGWPANVFWLGGTEPTLGDAANARRLVSFYYNGTTEDDYYGEFNSGTYS